MATYTTLVRNVVNRGDFALIDLDERLAIKPNLIDKWFAAPVISYYSLSESILGGSRRLFFYASGDDEVRCQKPRLVHESALQLSDGRAQHAGQFIDDKVRKGVTFWPITARPFSPLKLV